MENFASLPDSDKQTFFLETAKIRNINSTIIEKDFWVCWTLKKLFSISTLSPHLTFKGGTSLSKAYKIIERFSEDIDLTINKKALSLDDAKNPEEENISNNECKRRIDALCQKAENFIGDSILPSLNKILSDSFHDKPQGKFDLDNKNKQTILFFYPVGIEEDCTYIQKVIRLEFGARGDIEPQETKTITPYVCETFPDIFLERMISVPTLAAERTFWEKATILHALHHGSKLQDRISRHYYDVYMLLQKGVADKSLNKPELLNQVVANKSMYFRDNKASYETAIIGNLRLLPQKVNIPTLKNDYKMMDEMFMGEYPSFETIMETLQNLETRINNP